MTDNNDYLAQGNALITGLYQRAIKERKQGKPYRMAYLRHLEAIDPGEPVSLAFFLHGDSIGYTPGIEVEENAAVSWRFSGRHQSMAAGVLLGALLGHLASDAVYSAGYNLQEQPIAVAKK